MPSAGFEPATPATKRPQTYALDRATTVVGNLYTNISIIIRWWNLKYFSLFRSSYFGSEFELLFQ
jgi:hypothetical protein